MTAGRPTPYRGKAVHKSLTLDSELVAELEQISGGNLSQTVNEILAEGLAVRRGQYHARRLAETLGIEPDPELDARIDANIEVFMRELHERVEGRRAATLQRRAKAEPAPAAG